MNNYYCLNAVYCSGPSINFDLHAAVSHKQGSVGNLGPVALSFIASTNHRLRNIETHTFLWKLTLVSANIALNNSGLSHGALIR